MQVVSIEQYFLFFPISHSLNKKLLQNIHQLGERLRFLYPYQSRHNDLTVTSFSGRFTRQDLANVSRAIGT